MLVHWNSHLNIANMENEVYSERSMPMHSLCSIFFFCVRYSIIISLLLQRYLLNKHEFILQCITTFYISRFTRIGNDSLAADYSYVLVYHHVFNMNAFSDHNIS